MHPRLLILAPLALLASGWRPTLAQDLPAAQPMLITVIREQVKLGRNADHARIEAGWPAAFGRAKSPDHYLAFTSLTGPNEAWFVLPAASHAAMGAGMKRNESDPVLSAELARLARADADVLEGLSVIHAAARPDLSHGAFPDLSRARFWEITWIRMKPGHEPDFEAAAKTYGAAIDRVAPQTSYRVYEVIAGAPKPAYLVFASVNEFAEFDQMMADGQATMGGASEAELKVFGQFATEGLMSEETNRFRLDPRMSYVSAQTRATDPGFWGPPRVAAKPAAP